MLTSGEPTDIVTIMTVDEFMPNIQTPPLIPATPTTIEGTIAVNGQSVLLPATSLWLTGDTVNDTPVIQVGDLVLFTNPNGMAIHTITRTDTTHIYFDTASASDWFGFNQFGAPCVPMLLIKTTPSVLATCAKDIVTAYKTTTMFRAMMITYYVDYSSGVPLLTKVVNHCPSAASCALVPSSRRRRFPVSSRISTSPTTSSTASRTRPTSRVCRSRSPASPTTRTRSGR